MGLNKILLVDDDFIYLRAFSILLQSEGFDVTTASNGIEALEFMEKTIFRMIVTDLHMPEMNGINLAKKARKLHPQIFMVMVTGDEIHPKLVETATNAGISNILSKPLNITELLAIIRFSSRRD